jgi:hypothetical protein
MDIAAEYQIGNETFRAVAIRDDLPWGNGIKVSIFDQNGTPWVTTSFRCHPEFLDFDRFQEMDTSQLLEVAVRRLVSHAHAAIQSGKSSGITPLFGLNGAGQGRASEFPRRTATR